MILCESLLASYNGHFNDIKTNSEKEADVNGIFGDMVGKITNIVASTKDIDDIASSKVTTVRDLLDEVVEKVVNIESTKDSNTFGCIASSDFKAPNVNTFESNLILTDGSTLGCIVSPADLEELNVNTFLSPILC